MHQAAPLAEWHPATQCAAKELCRSGPLGCSGRQEEGGLDGNEVSKMSQRARATSRMTPGLISSRLSAAHSSRNSSTGADAHPTLM